MSIEEVIRKLEEMADDREEKVLPGGLGWDEIEPLREAVALLRAHPEVHPNEPLTMEELREIGGDPIWVKNLTYSYSHDGWRIIGWTSSDCVLSSPFRRNGQYTSRNYGLDWLAYRRPPKEDSHE